METEEVAGKVKEAWDKGDTGQVAYWFSVLFNPNNTNDMIAVLDELKKQGRQ